MHIYDLEFGLGDSSITGSTFQLSLSLSLSLSFYISY